MTAARGSSLASRLEEMSLKTIGTHDGKFTCNQTLACFLLKQLPEYKNANIIRTRDPAVLGTCDVVVAVGERYHHPSKRYDHLQRGFEETMNSLDHNYPWQQIRLRTAGLIYFHYGHRVLAQILGRDETDDVVKRIYAKVYEEFVQTIDAADNPKPIDGVVRFQTKTSLTLRVEYLLPTDNSAVKQQEQFNKAMALTGSEFEAKVKYFSDVWVPTMALAEAATEKQFEMFPDSKLVQLLQGMPWVDRVFTVDEVKGTGVTRKLYRIDNELTNDKWQVQLVSVKEGTYLVQLPVIETTVKRIGTHDGTFHCDEALACFMLKQLPEYKDALVIRTSDPAILDTCDIVVDAGGQYDHDSKRYDHHQSGFNKSMNDLEPAYRWTTPLSGAGLVYFYYGHRMLAQMMGKDEEDEVVTRIFVKLYDVFVEAVDGVDNGLLPTEGRKPYVVTTNLGDRVANLNPSWNDVYDARTVDDQFGVAMSLIGLEFKSTINRLTAVWWPAREIVAGAFSNRFETDESGEVIHLEPGCKWKYHLVELETEQHIENAIKFVIFHDSLANQYVVQCVPESLGSRITRLLLPSRWRGQKGRALQRASGVPDSSFVHRSGFVGYGQTFNSVLQMAHKTLAMPRD